MDIDLLHQAKADFDAFVAGLTIEERKKLSEHGEGIDTINLFHHAAAKDSTRFDQTINRLSNRYIYDSKLIPVVYSFYQERGLHVLALDYLQKARTFMEENGEGISPEIQALFNSSESKNLLVDLKGSFDKILNLTPRSLSLVTPDKINDKRTLSEFLLYELIKASKILLDKIQSVRQITHENRYNDLLLAILRLRFPIWGWSIEDQPRIGSSGTGKDAGSIDILVQCAGDSIAFIEALILDSADYANTESHILKCFTYVGYLDRYYVLIYFTGKKSNFDKVWTAYMDDVKKIAFPADVAMDHASGFRDLSSEFNDIRHLKLAKTSHSSNVEMFHMMVNLSRP